MMNKSEWFEAFENELHTLGDEERKKIVEYYEELYQDKAESGFSEEEIIKEFGSPESAAKKAGEVNCEDNRKAIAVPEENTTAQPFNAEKTSVKNIARNKKCGRFDEIFMPLVVFSCLIAFFLLGSLAGRWGTAWMLFLLIPIAASVQAAVKNRNPSFFAYPVLATLIFLAVGMYAGVWHPTWVIFLTIPVYYVIFGKKGKD